MPFASERLLPINWYVFASLCVEEENSNVSVTQNNCLHEYFFDIALERARELDRYFDESGSPIGPLHGLPISLKDQFYVEGVETTMGYVGWIDTFEGQRRTREGPITNSQIVDELLSLGAVLYCKVKRSPELLFHTEG